LIYDLSEIKTQYGLLEIRTQISTIVGIKSNSHPPFRLQTTHFPLPKQNKQYQQQYANVKGGIDNFLI
jgi:hypothetical protein